MRSIDTMRATRVGWAIAVVFGLVAVPSLADQIIIPAWHLLKLHAVTNSDQMKLLAGGIATVCVLVILSTTFVVLSMRSRRQ